MNYVKPLCRHAEQVFCFLWRYIDAFALGSSAEGYPLDWLSIIQIGTTSQTSYSWQRKHFFTTDFSTWRRLGWFDGSPEIPNCSRKYKKWLRCFTSDEYQIRQREVKNRISLSRKPKLQMLIRQLRANYSRWPPFVVSCCSPRAHCNPLRASEDKNWLLGMRPAWGSKYVKVPFPFLFFPKFIKLN